MNVFEIVKVIQDKITNTTSKEELIYLAKSLENLNLGQVKTVSTYTDLLNIKYPIEGELYFVDNEERLYYGFGSRWILVFNQAQQIAYGWGQALWAQLGNGTTSNRSSPVSVIGGFLDWSAVTAGYKHSVGLRADGTLWSWGSNDFGQLGDGTIVSKNSPISVGGGFTDWVSVSTGSYHSLAIRSNGTLWGWGYNSVGGLGDNTIIDRSSPVSVVGGFNDWKFVSAGMNASAFSLAIRSNGTLWAWGYNQFGQLGDNTNVSKRSPVSVVGGFTDWVLCDAGGLHSIAVRSNGTIWTWGYGTAGRLGDGTTTTKSSPVSVVGGFTDWISASVGLSHSFGIRSNGTLWAWGDNGVGELGDNTIVAKSSPVSVVGGFTDWISVRAGNIHALGLRANGTLWSWGFNSSGRLGDNTTVSKRSPVSVVGGFTDWISMDAGDSFSLGLRGI